MDAVRLFCRVTEMAPDGSAVGTHLIGGDGPPDLGTVEQVARLALEARRQGGRVVLAEVVPELDELLGLAGLIVEVER
jgi:hypothetical protein